MAFSGTNPLGHNPPASNSPATDAVAITPADGTVFTNYPRMLYIGGAGDVTVVTADGTTVTFKAVPVGTVLPIAVRTVKATGTTATNILGLA